MTATDVMGIGAGADGIAGRFVELLHGCWSPRILELGTLRWEADRPTHHRDWAPHASEYVMSDVAAGTDVDVVADAHDLAPFADASFDVLIAVSVWEHLARPWVAAEQVARVLRPDGLAYVCTHQTFPVHGYPSDYFRFSDRALDGIFVDAGLTSVAVGYAYPAQIIPPPEVTRWNRAAPAWLNVAGIWRKPSC